MSNGESMVQQESAHVIKGAHTQKYVFRIAKNKITPEGNISRHNNQTRKIWSYLKNKGWDYFGSVRDWTAVFGCQTHYLVIHHFITDKPINDLMGSPELSLRWQDLLLYEEQLPVAALAYGLEEVFKMNCMIPVQSFTDAYKQEACIGRISERLISPKHKLKLWFQNDDFSLLVEIYFGKQPYPPYGIYKPMEWPNLNPVTKYEKLNLFEIEPFINESAIKSDSKGEFMGIEEDVPESLLQDTISSIKQVFEDNPIVVIAFSGGKDSSVLLQLSVEFVLKNPEYQDKLFIVSASTGIENPIIETHLRSVRNAIIKTLNKRFVNGFSEDRFVIVEPDIDERFLVCIFGKSYQPPSVFYKWCISRLKIMPARKDLLRFSKEKIICQLLGVRSMESSARSRSVESHFGVDFYGEHVVQNIRTAAPIRAWSATDIATYLVRYSSPWSEEYSNRRLIDIYGFASGAMECPIGAMITNENDAIKGCGGSSARFGCVFCSVVKEDNSLKNLVNVYPDELGGFYQMRGYLKATQDLRYGGFTGYQRKRRFATFEPGFGDLTVDHRALLLEHWKRLDLPMLEEEILAISRMVKEREVSEGNPISERFWKALYALLPVHPGPYSGAMFDPLWEPAYLLDAKGGKVFQDTVGIDRYTQEDRDWIARHNRVCDEVRSLVKGQLVFIRLNGYTIEGEFDGLLRDVHQRLHCLSIRRFAYRKDINLSEWKVNEDSYEIPLAYIHELLIITERTIERQQFQYQLISNEINQLTFEF
ncbi:hypothetical protein [Paenibacillus sp. VTT E-133291]|uniref:hypothetical protein n=1 Tax=Paenibacillus sp. VTT E-133291 TaxID=1986223 RepID=UPI000BA10E7A|nr:hypothetical protein [Paenibacillus sp. VTT E-133291]OZQ97441.1 hypothetical protein CA598_06495 [Paenibacillus sp. VTT E-133291]